MKCSCMRQLCTVGSSVCQHAIYMVARCVLHVGRATGEQEMLRRHAMLRSYVMDQPEVT